MPPNPESTALGEAIAEWAELERGGSAPSIEEFVARHPAIAEPLRSCLGLFAALGSAGPDPTRVAPAAIPGFRILRLVGRGGMGLVYEAEQASPVRRVALKVLPGGDRSDGERQGRFRREIEATARLRHPHIVPVYASGEAGGLPYYAMPLLVGRSLDVVLEDVARGAPGALERREELVTWVQRFVDVARALDYAHREGIVHRDVKPSNLFLEDEGALLVLDFGLTRTSEHPSLTLTGLPIGSPRYMSPEQVLSGKLPIDARSDVFSLAATLYELLTLRPAHPGEDREAIFRAILSVDPTPPRRIDARVPRDLELVLLHALEKDPARRYASAGELADDLQRFLDYAPVRARPVGPIGQLRRRARRSPAAAVALGLGCLAVLVSIAIPIARAVLRARQVDALLARGNELLAAGDAQGARDVALRVEALAPDHAAAPSLGRAAAAALRDRAEAERREEARRLAEAEIEAALPARAELADVRGRIAEVEGSIRDRAGQLRPWLPPWQKVELLEERRTVDGLARRCEQVFREALAHLFSALRLDPGSARARREVAALAFDEYLAAERARDRARMQSLRPLIEAHDDGELREAWEGTGSLAVDSRPPGAEVWLFRYEDRDLRRIPVPCGPDGACDPSYLDGLDLRGPWIRLRVVDPGSADAPLQAGDEITSVCGAPPRDAASAAAHLAEAHPYTKNGVHYVEVLRGGQYQFQRLGPRNELALQGELLRAEAYPLPLRDSNRLGRAPIAEAPLAMGSYLALLRLDGAPDVRVPFEIGRLEREELVVLLPGPADDGSDYVYVPGGPTLVGGDPAALDPLPLQTVDVPAFWIQRREVTYGQYFAFLAELEQVDAEAARRRAPREHAGPGATPSWAEDEQGRIRPALAPGVDLDFSLVGVSWDDAQAYCRWLTDSSVDPGWIYDLPSELEWEKAARGVDGRLFPWGDDFDWTFARLGWSAEVTGLLPPGLYPTDESVYGALDLCGNVREWCSGHEEEPWRILRGAAWGLRVEEDCHLASRANKRAPEYVDTGTGFRVVRRRAGG